ncbi:SixA phosphatase family protein [Aeromonas sp. NJAU223]|uniref:SixA phosphatase family protein n=1 Tax=Aeromonas sp. NJAU223 TaxID=3115650 RepID=UPI003DA902EE
MKRTLVLVRHGKSIWADTDLPDRERPLAERGKRYAPMMGRRLAQEGVIPDLILSSPACRARETARLLADALQYPGEIALDERIYEGEVRTLLALIGELADDKKCVMLVGHDPEFTALAHRFSRGITRMPTCAVARFLFEGASWSVIPDRVPVRVWFDCPKQP